MFGRNRWLEYTAVISLEGLVAFIYFYSVFAGKSTFLSSPDNLFQFYPDYVRLSRSLSLGKLPLWDPGVESGRSFAGVGETAVFYPPALLVISLLGPSEPSLVILAAFHLIIGSFAFYLLARYLGNDAISSSLVGVSFTSITIITYYLAGAPDLCFPLVWTPLVVLCLYKSMSKTEYSALGGLFLAMSLLGGHIQALFNNLLIVGVLTILLMLRVSRVKTKLRAAMILSRAALIVLFGAGFSSLQTLSVMESSSLSYRWVSWIGGGLGPIPENSPVPFYAAANNYFLPSHGIIDIFNPFIYQPQVWAGQPYFGIFILIFALIGVVSLRQSTIEFLIVAALGLLLSLGGQTPLFLLLYTLIPFAYLLRMPGLFIFLFQFGMSIVAVFGFARLLGKRRNRTKILAGIVMLSLLTSEITYVAGAWGTLQPISDNPDVPSNVYRMNPIISYVERDYLQYRILNWNNTLPPNIGDVYPIETTLGYAATMNQRYYNFLNLNWSPGNNAIYDLLNVKYVVSSNVDVFNSGQFRSYMLSQNETLILQWDNVSLYQRPHPMPRFWIPMMVEHTLNGNQSLEAVAEFVQHNLNPGNMAIVEDGTNGIEQYPLANASVLKVIKYDEQMTELSVNASGDVFLVYSSVFDPGWTASIDGKQVSLFPAYYTLQAVKVPSGVHMVKFEYDPDFMKIGIPITATTALAAVLLYFYSNDYLSVLRRIFSTILARSHLEKYFSRSKRSKRS
jgi:hypothetical protein